MAENGSKSGVKNADRNEKKRDSSKRIEMITGEGKAKQSKKQKKSKAG